MTARAALALLAVLAAPAALHAQDADALPVHPRWWVGFDILAGNPLGTFGDLVDDAWGFQLNGRFTPNPAGPLGLRLDMGLMRYGNESWDLCLPAPVGCRIGAEVTTSNDIYFVALGPELSVWDRRLYAYGTLGLSVFSTVSSLSGDNSSETLLSTTNYDDGVLAFRFGGGARIPVIGGQHPVRLELGVDYHRNGVVEYLLEGDIVDNPDGSIIIIPNRSDANVMVIRLGVSFGLGPRSDSPEPGGDR